MFYYIHCDEHVKEYSCTKYANRDGNPTESYSINGPSHDTNSSANGWGKPDCNSYSDKTKVCVCVKTIF